MTTSTLTMERQSCFQLKTSFLPSTILQLTQYDLDALEQQIRAAISKAPMFFAGSPVVIDLEKVQTVTTMDFDRIKKVLIANGLVPIGARQGSAQQMEAAMAVGLPLINLGKTTTTATENKKKTDEPTPQMSVTKFVSTPIRSGMQVYAKESDLVVVAQVSPGAELMADGFIHVYGTLRGRAMAGVRGNTQARIFCQTLEAELVSIAGYYLTKEEMLKLPKHKGMIQIRLDKEQVKIESI